jgi:hypothetical protein
MTVKITKPSINVREELADLRKPTGIAGEAMLRAETPQEQFNLISAGRRNMVINGAMNVAQRATSVTGFTIGGYLTTDRFETGLTSIGTYTVSQSTDAPSGFAHSLKYLCTTADASPASGDGFSLHYKFEGQDLQMLDYGTSEAKSFTVSFWVKSNKTGTGAFNIRNTDQSRGINKSYVINFANTWEYKTIVIAGDTASGISNDSGHGLWLFYAFDSGSGWTSGTANGNWAAWSWSQINDLGTLQIGRAANDYIQITGVQVELGKVATPFEHRSYGEELAACQRYFQRLEWKGGNTIVALQYNTTSGLFNLDYTRKRANPSFVLPTATTATNQANGISFLTAGGSYRSSAGTVGVGHISRDSCRINFQSWGASGATGDATWGYFTSNASSDICFIHIDAEL